MKYDKIVLIGGSAGSFRIVCQMLTNLTDTLAFPVIFILHRPRNVNTGFAEALNIQAKKTKVQEPEDKQLILPGEIYLAPANYHLLCETKDRFALSTDDMIQYSRPSIDVTFQSASEVFHKNTVAIVLSGANKDGVSGALLVEKNGGRVFVQEPSECEVPVMPEETLKKVRSASVKTCTELSTLLNYI